MTAATHMLHQGFPTWGTFAYVKGSFKVRNRREKYIHSIYFQAFMQIISEYFFQISLYAYC